MEEEVPVGGFWGVSDPHIGTSGVPTPQHTSGPQCHWAWLVSWPEDNALWMAQSGFSFLLFQFILLKTFYYKSNKCSLCNV
jgi:hypothetical protein